MKKLQFWTSLDPFKKIKKKLTNIHESFPRHSVEGKDEQLQKHQNLSLVPQ